jgi:hypothetical protein
VHNVEGVICLQNSKIVYCGPEDVPGFRLSLSALAAGQGTECRIVQLEFKKVATDGKIPIGSELFGMLNLNPK